MCAIQAVYPATSIQPSITAKHLLPYCGWPLLRGFCCSPAYEPLLPAALRVPGDVARGHERVGTASIGIRGRNCDGEDVAGTRIVVGRRTELPEEAYLDSG